MTDDIVKQLRDSALRHGNYCRCQECNRNKAAADEIVRLTEERDEARKTCCQLWQKEDSGYITMAQLAADQKWDCFEKKETQ